MSGSLIPNGKQQYFDANGTPLAGGKVYYYIPYTTTAKNTWQDINLSILNTNPIILDAAGECIAWGAGAYRQQVYDVNNNLIWDQYTYGINPAGSNFVSQEEVQTATQGQTIFTLTTITYTPGINSLVVFVNGSKQLVNINYIETSSSVVTFASGLNVGDVVDFYASLPASTQNLSNAVSVAYNPPFTNSVATNVQAKLAQFVTSKDFGALATGTSDDQSAILNAGLASQTSSVEYNVNFVPKTVFLDNGISQANLQAILPTVLGQTMICNSPLLTSTSSVTAGTGTKSWTFPSGLLLQAGEYAYVYENSSNNYMAGAITSYNNATGVLTINVTSNQLGSSTYSNWYLSTGGGPRVLFQYGGATKGSSIGDYVQVASNSVNRPFNFVSAWYGNNGAAYSQTPYGGGTSYSVSPAVTYATPGGAIGFGTENPNQRHHIVGPNGGADSGTRWSESLANQRGLTIYPAQQGFISTNVNSTSGYAVMAAYDWGNSANYPLIRSSKNLCESDFSISVPINTTTTVATVSFGSAYDGCFIEVTATGNIAGGGTAGIRRLYQVYRNGGGVSVSVIQDMAASAPYSGAAVVVSASGNNALIQVYNGSGSPGAWTAEGNFVCRGGKPIVTLA